MDFVHFDVQNLFYIFLYFVQFVWSLLIPLKYKYEKHEEKRFIKIKIQILIDILFIF